MSHTTKTLMRKVRRKLTRVLDLEGSHCGHPEPMQKAAEARVELEMFIEDAIEELARKAGMP